MSIIDWLVVLLPLGLVLAVSVFTRRHVRNVSDFLAAGRSAGRYLISNAEGTAAMGAITIIAMFEQFYNAGPAIGFWGSISVPIWLMVTLTGFIIYRYRETRALTMAEFFEMRYSRRLRVFMGVLGFTAGIINYGIFPAVGARFIVYYCGLPPELSLAGVEIPTFALVMAAVMSINLANANLGGQLTAMVTDCIEGIISGVFLLIIALTVLYLLGLDHIQESFLTRPPGKSFLDPFDTFALQDFNIWFILIGIFVGVYSLMAWQGNQGFNASALNPHEAKMGRILGQWRGHARGVMLMLLGVCAFVYMNHPEFAAQADQVRGQLAASGESDTIRGQMTVPVALSHALPIGVKGMFLAVMVFAMMATDTSYMHSWGSIFIQDVVLPFRKKPLSPAAHIRLLRWAIAGVALFAFCFSLLFRQTEYIFMYFAVTGALYLGGAGSIIIGGLYWSRGTTAAAWSAMITGSTLALASIIVRQLDPNFPVNGQVLGFFSTLAAITVYVVVSLLTCRQPHDMDRLLHRGAHAIDADGVPIPAVPKPPRTWQTLIGIDENFTRGDRFQSMALFTWSMFWFAVFVVIAVWNLVDRWPADWWWRYFIVCSIFIPLAIGVGTTIWFGWGGVRDLRRLFKRLNARPAEAPAPAEAAKVPAATESKV